MFLDFYEMREQPFGGAPDPRFLYFGASHREALASLFYGIKSDCGFTALIAEPGLGKTTLTVQLLEKLRPFARTVFLCQTQCNSRELLQYILNELGTDSTGMEIVSMHNKLKEIISEETLAGRRFIIAVDEAQNLDADVLETIRLLSNIATARGKLLQILLIGQPQLAQKLASPTLRQLQQRIAISARLNVFSLEETDQYISHRLLCSGYKGDRLFSREAVAVIRARSQGIPRIINNLCFNALSMGCVMQRKRIDGHIMGEVFADIDATCADRSGKLTTADNAPVLERSVIQCAPPSSERPLGGWAMRTVVAAGCAALSIFVLFHFSSTIGRSLNIVREVSASGWHSVASSPLMKAAVVSTSDSANIQGIKKIPIDAPIALQQLVPKTPDVETLTVVVHPGDTLRQIALRTVGRYSTKIVDKIRADNPDISDPDHIEAGQKIKVVRSSMPRHAIVNVPTMSGDPKN